MMNAAQRFLSVTGIAFLLSLSCFTDDRGLMAVEVSVREQLSLQTEFWRTEFHQSKNEPIVGDDGSGSSESPMKSSDSGFELLMDLMAEEQSQFMANATSRNADDPMSTQADMVSGSAPSDWDRAAMSTAATRSLPASGNTGPSTVTMAVAVIGVIVLVGAYLRA
jgi:hypothetical protein